MRKIATAALLLIVGAVELFIIRPWQERAFGPKPKQPPAPPL
ncbi:MAG TPA: hypothetical protein VFH89_14685 [Sphingomicrobium sp.]|nr:hypothetical protein [Sphingomicrobium sp.]